MGTGLIARGLFGATLLLAAAASAQGAAQGAAAEAATPPPFTDRDVFELEYARDPQISPDGKQIVYARVGMDIMKDRAVPTLWVVDHEGRSHRPLLPGRVPASLARWSPDGGRIAYVQAEGGQRQIHVRWMDTGQTATVTHLTEDPDNLAWSPDGRWLAFTMLVKAEGKPLGTMPPKPDGAEWAPKVKVVDSMVYRADGAGFLEQGRHHLFVVPAEGGTPRQLTSGDFDHRGQPAWLPDGSAIIIAANRNPDWETDPLNQDLHEVSVKDGTIRTLTTRKGPDSDPAVSPDGRYIAFTGFEDQRRGYHNSRLSVLDRRTGEIRTLTEGLDRSVDAPAWTDEGKAILVSYEDRGNMVLARIGLDGRREVLAEDLGGTTLDRPYTSGSFSVSRNGRFAYTAAGPDRPADVAAGEKAGAARRLTDLNADLLGNRALGRTEALTWKSSADGREIQGWLITPPGFDPATAKGRLPLILEIHGGPFASYGPVFGAELQLFAAAGYAVLYTNPRGSTGYGDDFANQIHHNYPSADYDDLISGVDAVIAKGFVDPDRLYVTGGSGGGVLTAWIVGKTDRFKAAVVAKPVINWTSFALTADMPPYFTRYWFSGMPWEKQEEYWRRSPLSLVGNVKTPTMLVTGEADYRTPMSETEQYYQALKLRGIPTAMVRIPEAPHGIARRPSNLIAKANTTLAWFDRYRPEAAKPDTAKPDPAKPDGK
ncbi:alpha/beta hydrolase family protein [Rhodospirillum centenum]|uniref:Acylaminoacyl peptidase, putative n=1 Tax=Rhodospirillum centenum (strain ATCC 51521 / SW) TaxID=414684 RepID=B6IW65_RHOCS|nr:S9 family peptidase [Rhodospirillum centenum]ACJ00539.1 acylaminoacyl peptidase, putative [Rhodospirillum centenum SW]